MFVANDQKTWLNNDPFVQKHLIWNDKKDEIQFKKCLRSRVSVQGVESLWGDCRFIPADWGS